MVLVTFLCTYVGLLAPCFSFLVTFHLIYRQMLLVTINKTSKRC
jgi:hypothetical protein